MARIQTILVSAAVLLLAAPVSAQPFPRPRLASVMPPGAKAGTAVEVVIEGANLDDVTALYFSQPGIQAERVVISLPKPDPKAKKKPAAPPPQPVKFKVAVPADTPIGNCDVRVIGKYGVSNPRAFCVGTLTESLEVEPNNDVPQAQKIELNSTINGSVSNKVDVDYFSFVGKKDHRIVLRCAGLSVDSKLSPMLQVYDEDGQLIATKYQMYGDLVLDAILPGDGAYLIRLCEFAYQYGGADAFYRLSVTEAPWLDVAYPPAIETGKTTAVTVLGRNLPDGQPGPKTQAGRPLDQAVVKVTAPAQPTDMLAFRGLLLPRTLGLEGMEMRMKNALGASNPLLLTYCHQPVVLDNEANDTAATAQDVPIPVEICGRIEKRKDRDWYAFEAKKGEAIVFECFADRLGTPVDMMLQIWQPEPLKLLGEFDDHTDRPTMVGQFWTRTEDPKTRWVPPADGRYLVMVTSRTAAMQASPRLVYRLSVHRARPDFHVVLIDDKEGNGGGFTLYRGGNQELTVHCLRDDGFKGEVLLEAEGLPKGVVCEPQIVGPEVTESALVLRAAPDAPLDFAAFQVKATATLNGAKRIRQAHAGALVWPNPQKNAPAHSRLARSLCLAVRETGPFTLDVPVRELTAAVGAKLEVKVRAQRTWADFKSPIAVTRLAGPVQPGGKVIAVPTVNIAANQTEGVVKFQLPANTPPGTYNLVFQGKGKFSYQPDPKDPKKKKVNVDYTAASSPVSLTVFNTVVELTLDRPGIALKPGASGAVAVKIKRLHKYNGPIQLELVPQNGVQGITALPVTLAAGKNDGQLIVQSPKNAKPAVYANFLIRASAKFDGTVLKEETKLQVAISNAVSSDDDGVGRPAPSAVQTVTLLPESSAGWKYLPAKVVAGNAWQTPSFDDAAWRKVASPVGYGEPDVAKRNGTTIADQGQPVYLRREFTLPDNLLAQKGTTFRLLVASDDSATVYLNGQVVDKDDADHEFSYWNRDIALPAKLLRPGRNVVAVRVDNGSGSSDLYLDLAIQALTPVAPTKKK